MQLNQFQTFESAIKDLKSPEWQLRSAAKEYLLTIRDSVALHKIHEILEKEWDFVLGSLFIKLLQNFLIEAQIDQIGLCLIYLAQYETREDIDLANESRIALDKFFSSDKILQYQRNKVLNEVWPLIEPKNRIYITKKIGESKLKSVIILLFKNLETNNRSLLLMTIKSLKVLKDRRSSRYIVELLKNRKIWSDADIVNQCVLALGYLKNRADFKNVLIFLKHDDKIVKKSGVWALSQIYPKLAIEELNNAYKIETDIYVKEKIIFNIARIEMPRSAQILLDILAQETTPKLILNLLWGLQNMAYKIKIRVIFKRFFKANENLQSHIITIVSMITNKRCYNFLLGVLKNEKINDQVKINVIKRLPRYGISTTVLILESLANQNDSILQPHAISAILEHTGSNQENYLENFILSCGDRDGIFGEILLKGILKLSINSESGVIENFLLRQLEANQSFYRYLALRAAVKVCTQPIFMSLIKMSSDIDDRLIADYSRALKTHLQINPTLLEKNISICLRKEIYKHLDPVLINKKFIVSFIKSLEDLEDALIYKSFIQFWAKAIAPCIVTMIKDNELPEKHAIIITVLKLSELPLSEGHLQILLEYFKRVNDRGIRKILLNMFQKSGNLDLTLTILDIGISLPEVKLDCFGAIKGMLSKG